MKFYWLGLVLFGLTACTQDCNFVMEKLGWCTSTNNSLNLTAVDQYPVFKECKNIVATEMVNQCFKNTLTVKLSKKLQATTLEAKKPITEMITVAIKVNNKGVFSCETVKSSDSLRIYLPHLKDSIHKIVTTFKTVRPALKRGIPVSATFMVPVEIKAVKTEIF